MTGTAPKMCARHKMIGGQVGCKRAPPGSYFEGNVHAAEGPGSRPMVDGGLSKYERGM